MTAGFGNDSINGSESALAVDRAIMELRRGRVIAIVGDQSRLFVAALETASGNLLERLLSASDAVVLLVTAERAAAAQLNGSETGPVAISIGGAVDLESLRVLAGVSGAADPVVPHFDVAHWAGSEPLVAAAFALAKGGRLIPALIGFEADRFDDGSVATVTLEDLRESCDLSQRNLSCIAQADLSLAHAKNTRVALFRDETTAAEHLAIVVGNTKSSAAVPVRVHSSCLTGDLLGSLRCDCGEQLHTALARVAEFGTGVLLYLDQEGRGIGLANKLRAYSLQDSGLDTLDADRHLGFSADERNYDVAAAMLQALGISRVELMTNNPEKIAALRSHGIDVTGRLPLVGSTNAHNERYLRAKRERAGHLTDDAGSQETADSLF